MKRTVCEREKCTGCRACEDVCPHGAIRIVDELVYTKAEIDPEKCVQCGLCTKVCPNHNPVLLQEPLKWIQGWSNSDDQRRRSSSGGFAAEIAKAFVREGGLVCSCVFSNGEFLFRLVDNENEIDSFSGSKYVKSNPSSAYREMKRLMQIGRRVLFIGLPCQVAAAKNFVGRELEEQLTTVDLICHGTPSAELLRQYMGQHNIMMSGLNVLRFRADNNFRLFPNNQCMIHPRIQDRYTYAFLKSLTYTENCYDCRYATHLRAADITLGDSWGSDLSDSEIHRGISLALCQTSKGIDLLDRADVHQESVDFDKAVTNNMQLRTPSVRRCERSRFFSYILRGVSFDRSLAMVEPKACLKQDMKYLVLRFLHWFGLD